MTRHTRRRAFTLIEILLAISILVVLIGAVGIVTFRNVKKGADIKTTTLLVGRVSEAVERFKTDLNRYPTDEEGFTVLMSKPEDEEEAKKWIGGPYLKDKPLDAWGQELKYEVVEVSEDNPGAAPFHISSAGPDKEEGTDDDIKNWKDEDK